MPVLSTYLGHSSAESTYWYLEAGPGLLALAAARLEACSPEGNHPMTALAPILQAFFTDRLMTQRAAARTPSRPTATPSRLLLGYVHDQTGKQPAQLDLADLDAVSVGAFLAHLETARGNSAATRNNRLAAIHSLFRYAALTRPEQATISHVLAIQAKRTATTIVVTSPPPSSTPPRRARPGKLARPP